MLKINSDEQKEYIANIADSVANDIYSALESAVYVTVDLYTSKSICNFLDSQYKNSEDYYQEYNVVFNNYVFYATSKHLISNISFYSDNSTMINGGRYYRIDAIQEEEWYRKFKAADTDLFVDTYYNNTFYISHRKRMISVIRKLNYTGMRSVEKVVRLDLNYNQILETVVNSALESTVYLCHNDKIIYSNDALDKGENADFLDISAIDKAKVQAHKQLNAYGFDWDIYIMGYKSNYTSLLKDNLWLIVILFLADALMPGIMLTLFGDSITKRILLL
jgi:two-component system sensor histidine kinase YesM